MTAKLEANSYENVALECSVCLQTCVYPVQLPCHHIFCFLCVKGAANRSKRCALCRKEIPVDYFNHPRLVKISKELQGEENETSSNDTDQKRYSWYYEGRNGWWQYDQRTNEELENAYTEDKESIEILIAGFLYIIDFENMVQMRRNDPTRQRVIKRDLKCAPKKGVAGLKMQKTVKPEQKRSTCDGEDKKSDIAQPVKKQQSIQIDKDDANDDPIYASSLQFESTKGSEPEPPDYFSNPALELSSHTFHPVTTDHNYVNSDDGSGDYSKSSDWERASSGYTSMTSARTSLAESTSSDAYEILRAEPSGSSIEVSAASANNLDASSTNPVKKISRNARKRSGRMFSKEEVELPTPSVYESLNPTPAYLNDRRTQPMATTSINSQMSGLSINNENPRRQSPRHMTRIHPIVSELVPPPLPRRMNALNSNPQKSDRNMPDDSRTQPGRVVRENAKKDSKQNITHV